MKCEYRHPYRKDGTITKVTEKLWFTGNDPVSLDTQKEYKGRVTNSCDETMGKKSCTLRITDLKESDSAVYKFRLITNLPGGGYTGKQGIQLSVTDLHLTVSVQRKDSSYSILTLKCSSSCVLPSKSTYVWYENGQNIDHDKSTYLINSDSLDSISCTVKGHEDFPAPLIYAPVSPSLSADPSADIFEGSSVTLRCSSKANPPANYTWYKKTKTSTLQPLSRASEFLLNNIQSSDSGEYYCEAENQLGKRRSTNLTVDVKYPPRLPSVSVNPPGEIVVGGSVTLTCSSDASPAAMYAWYKENTASPAADGPMLTIVDIRHEDGGNYYCEARNSRGQHNSTLQLIVVTSSATSAIAGSITFLLLVGLFVVAFIIFRKKMASRPASEIRESSGENRKKSSGNFSQQLETPSTAALGNSTDQDDLCYAAVSFSKKQEEPVYSNFIPAEPKTPQHKDEEDDVEYSEVMVKKTPGPGNHDASEKICALYSPVNKVDRL